VPLLGSIELNREMGITHTPELKGATHPDRADAIFGSRDCVRW
jgi:hypothetical protein